MKNIFALLILFVMTILAKDIDEYKNINLLESTMESRISNELSLYTDSSFSIDVKIYTIRVDISKNQVQDNEKMVNLPGVYLYEEKEDNSMLNEDSTSQRIDHIEVVLTLDQDEDPFIIKMAKKIAVQKADLSKIRGDKVIVKQVKTIKEKNDDELAQNINKKLSGFEKTIEKIADKKNEDIDLLKSDIVKVQESTQEELTKLTKNTQVEIAKVQDATLKNIESIKSDVNAQLKALSKDQNYAMKVLADQVSASNERLYYWLAFITLALLVAAYLGFLYASHRSKNIKNDIKFIEDDFQKELQQVESKIEKKIATTKASGSEHSIDEALINDLATLVIARKDGVKEFILESLESEKGKEKIALLVQHIGMRSIETFFANSKETIMEIVKCVDAFQFDPNKVEEKVDALYKEILNYTKSTNNSNTSLNALGFLNKLSIDQLLLLLEGEDMSIKAFIISQIDKEKSAELFERLPEETRLYLYMEISNIKPMEDKEYATLAKKLSKKIVDLPQVNNYVVDGKEEMVDRIKLIDPSSQKHMLEVLMTQNIDLYRTIRDKYLFFQDIPELEEESIKSILFSMNEETIALALMQMSEEDKDRILAMVNERKMVMIDEKIRTFQEDRPAKQLLLKAQYRFTQEAEKIVKKA